MKKVLSALLLVVIVLFSIELACQLAFRVTNGYWKLNAGDDWDDHAKLIDRHPYIVGVLKPDVHLVTKKGRSLSTDSHGLRTPEFALAKKPGVVRILALGGSTTFCTRAYDDETWPFQLGKLLGDGFEVINMGVPGYSTVENLFQACFHISELKPDVVLFYEGWNDVRNAHIANLKPDYSNYHPRTLYTSLALNKFKRFNKVAAFHYLELLAHKTLSRSNVSEPDITPSPDKFTAKMDERLLELYKRNIRLLAAVTTAQGAVPVIIPQMLNAGKLVGDAKPHGWAAYLTNDGLYAIMDGMNAEVGKMCKEQGVLFVDALSPDQFTTEDFIDAGHFTPTGNKKFAERLAAFLTANAESLRGAKPEAK